VISSFIFLSPELPPTLFIGVHSACSLPAATTLAGMLVHPGLLTCFAHRPRTGVHKTWAPINIPLPQIHSIHYDRSPPDR